ncbi:MAG: hypothetical protein NT128_05775 [Proteobacteria bacterium]|nr:hypothetical protein [Pseudomonadota bacterium]
MKNFSIKNIALVLAVLFGTAAAYSMDKHHTPVRVDDLLVGGKGGMMKPAPRMHTPTDCFEEEKRAPKCDAWTLQIDKHGGKFTTGDVLVSMSSCGENITINGDGCISMGVRKHIVQGIELLRLVRVLNCTFNCEAACGLIAVLEKCECREEREDDCRPRKEDCHKEKDCGPKRK